MPTWPELHLLLLYYSPPTSRPAPARYPALRLRPRPRAPSLRAVGDKRLARGRASAKSIAFAALRSASREAYSSSRVLAAAFFSTCGGDHTCTWDTGFSCSHTCLGDHRNYNGHCSSYRGSNRASSALLSACPLAFAFHHSWQSPDQFSTRRFLFVRSGHLSKVRR